MKSLKTLYPVFILLMTLGVLTGCGFNSPDPDDHEEQQNEPYEGLIPDFQGPTYSEDYTPIFRWSDRSIWNLANVHDPTVIKDGDYFYMYQTNASYGNVHEAGGNYPARRSTDLVNWEYLGAVFDSDPAWVKNALNRIRANMDPALPALENPVYGFWAPHITKVGNTFRLYYSVVVLNPILESE